MTRRQRYILAWHEGGLLGDDGLGMSAPVSLWRLLGIQLAAPTTNCQLPQLEDSQYKIGLRSIKTTFDDAKQLERGKHSVWNGA